MRKLAVSTFVTLDGVMQAPGGPEEDTSGGFTHGGWSVNYWDEKMGKIMDEASTNVPFDLLLGRKTYEIFAAHWPHADDAMAERLNGARKFVASRTLKSLDWQNSTLLEGDVAQAVAALKEQEGPEIQVHGSGNLIQTLLKHDLVDEFRVWIFPVVVGKGKRLFAEGAMPGGLKLTETQTSTTGVVISYYERAGEIPYGTFEIDVQGETSKLWTETQTR
jgi:dihydrofolate reductase